MTKNVVALQTSYVATDGVAFLCNACGVRLTDSPTVTVDGKPVYVVCPDCGIAHLKTPTGLARVALDDLAPEFVALIKEVIARHWSQRITVAAAYRAA